MDSKKIQTLLTVLETGSMLKAATELGYTPSGLAHMMDSVESEMGLKILERGRFGVRLTKEGELLLPHMQNYVKAEMQMLDEAKKLTVTSKTVLRIGTIPTAARLWLNNIVREYRTLNGDVDVILTEDSRDELYQALVRGEYDMIVAGPHPKYRHEFVHLRDDDFFAVLPPDSDYPRRFFMVKDFESFPFIMPTLGKDTDILDILEKNSVNVNVIAASADEGTVLKMVEKGLGVSMLSHFILSTEDHNVRKLPLYPEATRMLGIAVRSVDEMTEPEKDFLYFIRSSFLD
ncbi:MAG: LysR family transcriptional regulator [Ruminococcaceae bacterium]|nr:LysR family transcriptional regulator [Oscillospiraceae bacterium]